MREREGRGGGGEGEKKGLGGGGLAKSPVCFRRALPVNLEYIIVYIYTIHQSSLVFARFSILFLNTKHYTYQYHWINLYILATMQVSKNICKYEKRRSAVNAMADSSRWSLNLSEIWTQSVTNGQRIFSFVFWGMKHHAWLAIRLDTKVSLFSSQMVYKLWRIVQLVSCCFQLKLNNPHCPTFRKPLFVHFRQVFLFLILLLVTKAANFYFNYSSMHTE